MLDRQELRQWQAEREDADRKWRAVEHRENQMGQRKQLTITVVAVIVAALLGGWAQATFHRDPVINVIVPPSLQQPR